MALPVEISPPTYMKMAIIPSIGVRILQRAEAPRLICSSFVKFGTWANAEQHRQQDVNRRETRGRGS